MVKQVSIIGFGRFGKYVAKHLVNAGMEVFASSTSDRTNDANEIGAKFVSLDEACKKKIIILAMPMENLEGVLESIKDKITAGTLVLDVCSLKVFACELMDKILPKNVEVIGTHPLFGPQSARESIEGMKIALVNVRAKKEIFASVKDFCDKLKLNVIITTAEEHDRQMAVSQALTHFIGQVCKNIDLKRVELSTKTFDDLMNIVEIIKNDTPALFENMEIMNPFAKEARANFVKASKELDDKLNS